MDEQEIDVLQILYDFRRLESIFSDCDLVTGAPIYAKPVCHRDHKDGWVDLFEICGEEVFYGHPCQSNRSLN